MSDIRFKINALKSENILLSLIKKTLLVSLSDIDADKNNHRHFSKKTERRNKDF
jgi:hypothetical protein